MTPGPAFFPLWVGPSEPPIDRKVMKRRRDVHPRLYRLIETHQRIDNALRQEQRRRWPDPLRLTQLKRLKLRVKDLIHRFAARRVPA